MSKQLAISASASVFAMAAFVLLATPTHADRQGWAQNQTGATTEVTAPAMDRTMPVAIQITH